MNRLIAIGAIVTISCFWFACHNVKTGKLSGISPSNQPSIRLSISPAPETTANLKLDPARLYVSSRNNQQEPPCLILKASGAKPGTKIYWSYQYRGGPFNSNTKLTVSPFHRYQNHHFNRWENSTIADKNGESKALFKTTTYAGDRFQFGIGLKEYLAGFKNESSLSIRFRNAFTKSKTVEIWKHIRFERPRVLQGVRFPRSTWNYVIENLEGINIECRGDFTPVRLNPADSSIFYYFYTSIEDPLRGRGRDPRYGPEGYGPIDVMLSRINIIYSDEKTGTISLFIFGATSPKKDLINNRTGFTEIPAPVDYNHSYRPEELNLLEWSAYGTGSSMAGKSPAVFIWSDFWWLASKSINISHDKSLARVMLHEIGHHLLMFKSGGNNNILDSTGHPKAPLVYGKSIMTGSGILRFNKRGKSFVSQTAVRLERRFIENLRWNPKVEMLIRRDFSPFED
jgi:hypothetical protein